MTLSTETPSKREAYPYPKTKVMGPRCRIGHMASKETLSLLKWGALSLSFCTLFAGGVGAGVYSFLKSKPKYFSHEILIRAGNLSTPLQPGTVKGINVSKFLSGNTSTESGSLAEEAVAYLDFKFEASKTLKRILFSREKPAKALVKSVEPVKGTDYINVEVWGLDPQAAESAATDIAKDLDQQFGPRIQAAIDSLLSSEQQTKSLIFSVEKSLKELDSVAAQLGYNDVVIKQKAAGNEALYLLRKDMETAVNAIKLGSVRPFSVLTKKTGSDPAFPAAKLISALTGMIALVLGLFMAFAWFPTAMPPSYNTQYIGDLESQEVKPAPSLSQVPDGALPRPPTPLFKRQAS